MTVKEPGTYTRLDALAETLFAADSLVIYRQLLQDEVLTELRSLLKLVFDNRSANPFDAAGLYCSVCSKLYSAGMGLKEYVLNKLLHSENCFSRAAGVNGTGCLDGALKTSVRRDLEALHTIASLEPELLKGWISGVTGYEGRLAEAVKSLPGWPDKRMKLAAGSPDSIRAMFMESDNWDGLAEKLAEYHFQHGSGIFSEYRAFVWKHGGSGGYLEGVESPDPVTFAELVSYEIERSAVIENTEQFLGGHPANNILLYGTKGTGKSATVKALLNEYSTRGLRMIEVPKKLLADFPEIIRQLSGRGQKFILFIRSGFRG
jgi:predicted AAA+ superfamily ATPase